MSESDDSSNDSDSGSSDTIEYASHMDPDLWHAIYKTTALMEARMDLSLFGNTNKPPDNWKPNLEYIRLLQTETMPDPNWTDTDESLKLKLQEIHTKIQKYITVHNKNENVTTTILTDYLAVIDEAYKTLHILDDEHKSHYKQIVQSYNALITNENEHIELMNDDQKNRDKLYVNETKHKQLAENWETCLKGTFIPYTKGILDRIKQTAQNTVKKLNGK